MDRKRATWKDIVKNALEELGGQAHLSEINKIIEGHPKTRTNPTWQNTIRRVVRQYKIFEPVPPERSGVYRLTKEAQIEARPQGLTKTPDIDHGIVQGMLVALGKIYGYETYVPRYDQTTRVFQGKALREFISVSDCTDIFEGPNLSKIREIDVMWFDEDDYGLFPVYAFEVEGTTDVKRGMDRLLKIPKRFSTYLFIIAPGKKEKDLFDRFINQTPFRDFRNKFRFRFYEELEDLYNSAMSHHNQRERFGVIERDRLNSARNHFNSQPKENNDARYNT